MKHSEQPFPFPAPMSNRREDALIDLAREGVDEARGDLLLEGGGTLTPDRARVKIHVKRK